LTKLPGVISQARKATSPFEAWKYLITDEILGNIVQQTNQSIVIDPTSSRANDARLTDKIEIKAFIDLPCLAGVFRSDRA
jgi:hypothetical protein